MDEELRRTPTELADQAAVLQRGGTGGGGVGVVPTHDHLPGVVADVVLYAPVRKSYHRVCFLLPHVKPIRFLPTIQYTLCLVLVVLSQEYSMLTICLARSVSLTAPSCPADRTPWLE